MNAEHNIYVQNVKTKLALNYYQSQILVAIIRIQIYYTDSLINREKLIECGGL